MSLGIVVKGPSGIVLAADSRVTLTAQPAAGAPFHVNLDNASKLLTFGQNPHHFVAAVTYGQAVIPAIERTAESFLPEFQATLAPQRVAVADFASSLSAFYMSQWPDNGSYQGEPMLFQVAGFDAGQPYGRVFQFALPYAAAPTELHTAPPGFGASWGGQTEIVDRIYKGYQAGLVGRIAEAMALDPAQRAQLQQVLDGEQLSIPLGVMALQDCVNLAETLIRTTIAMQQLAVVLRGVGGPIDIVTITRTGGVQPIRLKEVAANE